MKSVNRWYSPRLERDISVVRWGHFGRPVLVFPTAGGDAEEIERMRLLDVLDDLVAGGRVKVYSCDSVAGRAMVNEEGTPRYRTWLMNQFHQFVYHEMVPAIRADCDNDSIGVVSAGASIGAFNALAVLCRFPDVFTDAICMSGTYDMTRFIAAYDEDLFFSSPLHFLPGLDGSALDQLRQRNVILASGEGAWENIGESWRVAEALGSKGVPNRVDGWGPEYEHNWPTWRAMLPHYLNQLA
ncbi:MAG TPA: alpha/beta hydrolase-fold protein [Mycobacteriales bacterium]|nr:alpha/beta hydrolase-fold protein [Mycobacteriales bacterium]